MLLQNSVMPIVVRDLEKIGTTTMAEYIFDIIMTNTTEYILIQFLLKDLLINLPCRMRWFELGSW
jgi:hypothetical protein